MSKDILFLIVVFVVAGSLMSAVRLIMKKSLVVLILSCVISTASVTAVAGFMIGFHGFGHLAWALPVVALQTVVVVAIMWKRVILELKNFDIYFRSLSEGEGDLTSTIDNESANEFGNMALNFNSFLGFMKTMVGKIHHSTQGMNTSFEQMQSHLEETAAAISQIDENSRRSSDRMGKQNEAVVDSREKINEISTLISSLNDVVGSQASAVQESTASIDLMMKTFSEIDNRILETVKSFEQLTGVSQAGKDLQDNVSEKISVITNDSGKLTEANSIIQSIAAQTNLLAMNAAIEAAHAGEAGRGFAVVADEIRKLAETSSEQSKTINTFLNQIIGDIYEVQSLASQAGDSFSSVDVSVNKLNGSMVEMKNAVAEQMSGSREIMSALGEIRDVTEKVRTDTGEINRINSGINGSIEDLVQMSSELELSMREITDGIGEIRRSSEIISENGRENRESIQELHGLVGHFSV